MNRNFLRFQSGRSKSAFFTWVLTFAIVLAMVVSASAQSSLVKLSTDTFHNSDSEHHTEVEPDTYAWGSTIVSAFQVARVPDGGGADVGFATSKDGGKTFWLRLTNLDSVLRAKNRCGTPEENTCGNTTMTMESTPSRLRSKYILRSRSRICVERGCQHSGCWQPSNVKIGEC